MRNSVLRYRLVERIVRIGISFREMSLVSSRHLDVEFELVLLYGRIHRGIQWVCGLWKILLDERCKRTLGL